MRIALFSAFAALLLLTACYQPLYGDKPIGSVEPTAQEARLNSIFINHMEGESGQKLRNLLIDRMYGQGRPAKTDYRLEADLKLDLTELGIQKNAVTTRARITLNVNYKLIDTATRKVLFTDKARSIAGYTILDEQFATLSSKQNAAERALTEIADRMVNRTLLYFSEGK